MGACAVRLHFALLAAKGEGVFIAKHDCVRHLLKLRPCCFSRSLRRILKGLGVGLLICFCPPFFWQWHVTYMPNATWRRRGVATAS